MTIFTRNDKPADTGNTVSPAAQNTGAMPPAVEPRRTVASAQTISAPPQPASRAAGTQTAGVSVISKALKITGQLESTEDIEIEGEIDGDVRGVSVKVGSNAKVKGTVYGDDVELSGTVEGKIEARKVVLTGTARMSGDVVHEDISIQSGAYIDGHCKPEFGKSVSRATAPAQKPAADKPNGAGAKAAPSA